MPACPKEIYRGKEKLIISIDLGTTTSAVAYAHLLPRSIPQVEVVNEWPGQDARDSKIPSLVAYKDGIPIACGAEALKYDRADDGADGVSLEKWFKLDLYPDSMKIGNETPLRPPITLKKIYADLLGYLFTNAQRYFKENTVDGARIWTDLGKQVTICLAIPNGWEISQQAFLRKACILGGLLPEDHAEHRLRFVTEGEASVHYALNNIQSTQWLHKGVVFAVVDAGGSTVDSTLYQRKEITPKLVLKEVCASMCVQTGGVFVDRAAQQMLKDKLNGTRFGDGAYLHRILEIFEGKTKRNFDGTQARSDITFSEYWNNNPYHDVHDGRITLTKDDVEQTFIDVVIKIRDNCLSLVSGRKAEHLLLVGGFGKSPFLRRQLEEKFTNMSITIDDSTKKAAAEGAAIWYIKQLVVARAARSTFGIIVKRRFDATNPDHLARKHKLRVDHDGISKIYGFFHTWVRKDSVIGEESSRTFPYSCKYKTPNKDLSSFSVDLYAYAGEDDPGWAFNESGDLLPNMRRVCTLKADLSGLQGSLKVQQGQEGQDFWEVNYNIEGYFGGTDLKAKLTWHEGSIRREGSVKVIPNAFY